MRDYVENAPPRSKLNRYSEIAFDAPVRDPLKRALLNEAAKRFRHRARGDLDFYAVMFRLGLAVSDAE